MLLPAQPSRSRWSRRRGAGGARRTAALTRARDLLELRDVDRPGARGRAAREHDRHRDGSVSRCSPRSSPPSCSSPRSTTLVGAWAAGALVTAAVQLADRARRAPADRRAWRARAEHHAALGPRRVRQRDVAAVLADRRVRRRRRAVGERGGRLLDPRRAGGQPAAAVALAAHRDLPLDHDRAQRTRSPGGSSMRSATASSSCSRAALLSMPVVAVAGGLGVRRRRTATSGSRTRCSCPRARASASSRCCATSC